MDPTALENLRQDYKASSLDRKDVTALPLDQFKIWFDQALQSDLPEPNAMILATATLAAQVSQRTVLLKGLTPDGLIFYTNYNSQKSNDLKENPQASLLFLWLGLQRQVRFEGRVEKISAADSQRYFQSRPKGSQIGAWASPQSAVIADRADLEKEVKAIAEKYAEEEVLPLPPHWGGYILKPTRVEFWQGRPSRLHDRIVYRQNEKEQWTIERLAP